MPPSNSARYDDLILTSLEGVLKGEGIVDFEPFLRPTRDTALVLIEADVDNVILS